MHALKFISIVCVCQRRKIERKKIYLWRDKITGALFYRDLSSKAMWHFLSIPFQALQIVFITIEKMNLAGCLLNAWMEIEHFQQGACTTFSHADDQTLYVYIECKFRVKGRKRTEGYTSLVHSLLS